MPNIVDAIVNLIENSVFDLANRNLKTSNSINVEGDSFEEYIKDLFAGTFDLPDGKERTNILNNVFSYLGNHKNPPDAILRGGDALEMKKISSVSSIIQMNSSFPKSKLESSSRMINANCRCCEDSASYNDGNEIVKTIGWKEKDIIYCVGIVSKSKLKALSFVYGADYACNSNVYDGIRCEIQKKIQSINSLDVGETGELGRINNTDPLRITSLRVREMWTITNPFKVFGDIYSVDSKKKFNFMAIINDDKWNCLENKDKLIKMKEKNKNLKIIKTEIRDSEKPENMKPVRLITFDL